MRNPLVRFSVVFLFIYLSLIYGKFEHAPLMKLVHVAGFTALFAFWSLNLWRSGRGFPASPVDWPLWLGVGAWFVSALLSDDPRVSLEAGWIILVHLLLFYLFLDLMRRGYGGALLEGFLLTAALVVFLTGLEMAAWYFGWSLFGGIDFEQGWPVAAGGLVPDIIRTPEYLFGNQNSLGADCLLALPVAVTVAETTRQRDLRWGLRGLALGLAMVVVLTRSRGVYLATLYALGLGGLFWLLRAEVRARLRLDWLRPRLLVGGFLAAVLVGIVVIIYLVVGEENDAGRIALYWSAIDMFEDRPLLGVGPFRFGPSVLDYNHWTQSKLMLKLITPHNIILHLLAEGGLVVFTLATWLVVRVGRVWARAWRDASRRMRFPLEGTLIALTAFAVYNLTDTVLETRWMASVWLLVAFVAHTATNRQPVEEAHRTRRHGMALAVAAALVVILVVYFPLLVGQLRFQRATLYLGDDWAEALRRVREVEDLDPRLDLYQLQAANILGFLANEQPEDYLADAIQAHEDALAEAPTWHVGWHNLAALYAQAGSPGDAIRAENRAIEITVLFAEYYFALGLYHEQDGDLDAAQAVFVEMLKRDPRLAASDFWTNPAYPQRPAVLDGAIRALAQTDPVSALDAAVFAGNDEQAQRIAKANQHQPSGALQRRIDLLPAGDEAFHLRDYYTITFPSQQLAAHLLRAERLLRERGTEAAQDIEDEARQARFYGGTGFQAGSYVLARLAERQGADPGEVERLLDEAVPSPTWINDEWFATRNYGGHAYLLLIPQARMPRYSPVVYQPLLDLAARHEAAGAWDAARATYTRILEDYDPFAWRVQEWLDALREVASLADD